MRDYKGQRLLCISVVSSSVLPFSILRLLEHEHLPADWSAPLIFP